MTVASLARQQRRKQRREVDAARRHYKRIEAAWRRRSRTEREQQTCAALDALPRQRCARADPKLLARMRMPPGECHVNAWWYASQNPALYEAAHGWVAYPEAYVRHSVVKERSTGNYICITPPAYRGALANVDAVFEFVHDPEVAMELIDRPDGRKSFEMWRNGIRLCDIGGSTMGLRRDHPCWQGL